MPLYGAKAADLSFRITIPSPTLTPFGMDNHENDNDGGSDC